MIRHYSKIAEKDLKELIKKYFDQNVSTSKSTYDKIQGSISWMSRFGEINNSGIYKGKTRENGEKGTYISRDGEKNK